MFVYYVNKLIKTTKLVLIDLFYKNLIIVPIYCMPLDFSRELNVHSSRSCWQLCILYYVVKRYAFHSSLSYWNKVSKTILCLMCLLLDFIVCLFLETDDILKLVFTKRNSLISKT